MDSVKMSGGEWWIEGLGGVLFYFFKTDGTLLDYY